MKQARQPFFLLLLLLLGAGLVYYPALDSLFLLDDTQNLRDLAGIDSRGFGFFLFGGDAGPGGRPLSLLSFALQHQSWPADPFAFKLVNLLLHLGNGVLVYLLCRQLFPFLGLPQSRREIFCLSVTGLWLLHPMQLSTVLYVVQRMTILSSLFMLLGMVGYLAGRKLYQHSGRKHGLFLAIAGVWLGTLLGIFSKEIGILLPLYLLVIELVLLPAGPRVTGWHRLMVPVLLLPLVAFALYLVQGYEGLLAAYRIREYTVGQRLLTEANVLLDYLKLIFIPAGGAFSVFHDDYRIATGLLDPPRTLISMLIICMLIALAFVYRKKWVVVSFAVLWFFAGHLLESSFLGLELYFEHRNYLPLLGMAVLISWGLLKITGLIYEKWLRLALMPVYLLAILLVTFIEIGLWSNPLLQAHDWTRKHPGSKRAANHLLNTGLILDNREVAFTALERLQEIDARDIYPAVKEITIRACFEEEALTLRDWNNYNGRAAAATYRGLGVITELQHQIYQVTQGHCPALDVNRLSAFTDVLIQNPSFHPVKAKLHELATTLAVLRGDGESALAHIDEAIRILPSVDNRIYKARILLAAGGAARLDGILREITEQLQKMPGRYLFYRDIIRELELALSADGQQKVHKPYEPE